ncbi:MAG: DUF1318 domain-containing protein [candidate division KSB1 bacterium]|nr:DUF1318 domain-containing protein [candidate division KSB1 bacterium]
MRWILIMFSLSFMGCSIKAPEITLTGEKTVIESQILGTHEQIQHQTWLTASARSGEVAFIQARDGQQTAVQDALENRRFYSDDINELKRDQTVGENNKGFLDILGGQKYENDMDYHLWTHERVDLENKSRSMIYQRLIAANISVSKTDSIKVARILAQMRQEESPPETLIQTKDGRWLEKPKK